MVANRAKQDEIASRLIASFEVRKVIDRRLNPSHGYRAVHIVVIEAGMPVEIQIRTPLQDQWAQCVERVAFTIDPAVKYGGGPSHIRDRLLEISAQIAEIETKEVLEGLNPEASVRRAASEAGVRIQLETVAIMAHVIKRTAATPKRGRT